MIIKDIKTQALWDIYKPEWITVTYVGLNYVEAIDKANGTHYTFRIGDATMAGIEIPKEMLARSVFDYANLQDEPQHGEIDGSDTQEDSEKLT